MIQASPKTAAAREISSDECGPVLGVHCGGGAGCAVFPTPSTISLAPPPLPESNRPSILLPLKTAGTTILTPPLPARSRSRWGSTITFPTRMGRAPKRDLAAHARASASLCLRRKRGNRSHEDLAMKRRGRPCRYKPDGLRPSPSLSQPSTALVVVPAPGPEKRRGRLPRSGKMRQLASLAR
jgi:hypothetical protein